MKGSVLITGGTGRLGMCIGQALINHYGVDLIINGRRSLDSEIKEQLDVKESNVYYLQGDICDLKVMQDGLKLAEQHVAPLIGVIHMAGMFQKESMIEKSEEDFLKTLRPKSKGVLVLDEITKDKNLEYFAIFSSTSSVLGDFGQCDYAVGNSFLDQFAKIRRRECTKGTRSGRTILFNWPLWKDGGIHFGTDNEKLYLAASRTEYLSSEQGVEIFLDALEGTEDHIIVIPKKKKKVSKREKSKTKEIKKKKQKKTTGNTVLLGVKQVISEVLELDVDEIGEKQSFAELGFDSMSLKDFSISLNENLSVNINPSVFFAQSNAYDLAEYLQQNFGDTITLQETEVVEFEDEINEEIEVEHEEIGYLGQRNDSSSPDCDDVAIIGMSGQFPNARNLDELWELLEKGESAIREIPKERWNWEEYYTTDRFEANKTVSKWGGFVENYREFDPAFFHISPYEAELMDPQHRLFLQNAWHVMEDAGYTQSQLSGKKVGVFGGVQFCEYEELLKEQGITKAQVGSGNAHAMLCNRVSYIMDFHGPSESIDTACSSSLVAVHRAVESIQHGECDMALAGGINLNLSPLYYIITSQMGILSPDGACKTFDERANGYVRGEGVGLLFLKPLKKAKEDHDTIYGVIKATTINHGGRANSPTAPNAKMQQELIVDAYRKAGIKSEDISYIEVHGTGTELGDPVEIDALKGAFAELSGKNKVEKPTCGLGSIKTNIGHLEPASGIAGIMKILQSLKHNKIPATLNYKKLNPYIHLEESPFYINDSLQEWRRIGHKNRIAGVSSFGFGGTNAHVVISDYEQSIPKQEIEDCKVFVLSARNKEQLKEYAKSIYSFLSKHSNVGSDESIQKVRAVIADILEVSDTLIDDNENLSEYGIDREFYVSLANQLNRQFNLKLTFGDIYHCETVAEIGDIVASHTELVNIVEESDWKYRLCDVLYTLQVGRVCMEERIAFPVQDKNDLLAKLAQFIVNDTCVNGYQGSVNGKERAKEISKSSVCNVNELAEHFVKGAVIDWDSMYQEKPYRISMPGYPFAKNEYWFESTEHTKPLTSKESRKENGIHKMGEGVYEMNFSLQDTVIRDHVIHNRNIVPGTQYIEAVRQVGTLHYGKRVQKVKNICWYQPIFVEEPSTMVIHFIENGQFHKFEIKKKGSDGICCTGSIELSSDEMVCGQKIAISKIQGECHKEYTKENCYETFLQRGYQYGKTFQRIQTIVSGNGKAVGNLGYVNQVEDKWEMAPGLLDSALQTASVLIPDDLVYLPFSMSEVAMLAPIKGNVYSVVHEKNIETKGTVCFHIQLVDEIGTVLVDIQNFVMRLSVNQKKNDMLYLKEQLVAKELECTKGAQHILLFSDENRLSEEFIRQGKDVILVQYGTQYRRENEKTFTIRKDSQEDYEAVFSEIASYVELMVYTCGTNPFHLSQTQGLEETLFDVTAFCKAHGKSSYKQIPCILLQYVNAKEVNPCVSAISGLLASIQKESYQVHYQLVNVEEGLPLSEVAKRLPFENGMDCEVNYTSEGRYKKCLVETKIAKEDRTAVLSNGIYIIFGGLGGAGKLLAEHLLRKNSTVLLCGRKNIGSEQLKGIAGYQDKQVQYVSVDVSDQDAVAQFLGNVVNTYGRIDGIFHAAGVIRDRLFVAATKEELSDVVKPKAYGMMNLIRCIQKNHYDIKFILGFSSMSGVLGNRGQSGYAFGNAFMDACTKLELPFEVKTIAWPYWKEGGMQIDEASLSWMKRQGLEPMETEDAMEAIEYMVAQHEVKTLGVLCGKRQKCIEYAGGMYGVEQAVSKTNQNVKKPADNISIGDKLLEICSDLLKVAKDQFDYEEELNVYGLDSILMMQLLNRIEKEFQVVVEPNLLTEQNTIGKIVSYLIEEAGVESTEVCVEAEESNNTFVWEETYQDNQGSQEKSGKIAVIGMACHFPESEGLDEFWNHLIHGDELIREVPKDRWNMEKYYDPDRKSSGKSYNKWGGFIKDIYHFAPEHFGIEQQDAKALDPSHRIVLGLSEELFLNAGYTKDEISGSRTSVFIGGGESTYVHKNTEIIPDAQMKHLMVNSIQNMMSARISDYWNLKGPSMVVDTACSSSLVAVHQACQSIRNKECNMAIAGGVEIMTNPYYHIAFSKAEVLSEDSHCYVFDERANGFILGEGAGLVLLKDYEQAVKDNDQIYGVICGSAVNNDGHTIGITVPSMEGQMEVIEQAIQNSHVDRKHIGYLEAHGTGTLLGDPIEVKAASQVYGKENDKLQYCAVGSVKSNIGHLMRAAGIASFIKVMLSLKHKQIPPTLNCSQVHKRFRFEQTPFYPVTQPTDWPCIDGVYCGAISSFGFGGTNCHMIVEAVDRENEHTRKPLLQSSYTKSEYVNTVCCEYGYGNEEEEDLLMQLLDQVDDGAISLEDALDSMMS